MPNENEKLLKIEKDILDAMKKLNASKEASSKTVKDIAAKANRPKTLVANTLDRLTKRKVLERKVVGKSAHYFIPS
jgi:predicted transcriptional regulator